MAGSRKTSMFCAEYRALKATKASAASTAAPSSQPGPASGSWRVSATPRAATAAPTSPSGSTRTGRNAPNCSSTIATSEKPANSAGTSNESDSRSLNASGGAAGAGANPGRAGSCGEAGDTRGSGTEGRDMPGMLPRNPASDGILASSGPRRGVRNLSATPLTLDDTAPSAGGWSRRARPWMLVEVAAVLLSPLVAFFGLRVARMVRPDMIDPYFYTAYAQNGRDLIERYGDGFYYWVRLGFILPARASYLAFGAVPGFYILRYLLALVAVVPVYLLLRRLHGRAAGALGVAVALSSPVVLHSWGTDYPDSAAVSYLFAGAACLVMPAASRRARLGWVVLAGIALALALHCQFVSAPLVGAIVIGYVALNVRREPLHVMAHLGVLVLCGAAVTGALTGLAQLVFGSHNIIAPTVTASEHFRTPEQLAKWHSTTWRWVLGDTYLLALPAALAGWCAARLGRGRPPSPAELAVVVAVALQGLFYAGLQFYGSTATLEYYLYSSMLWPGVCLVTAFLLVALCAPLLESPSTAVAPSALVVAVPLLMSQFSGHVRFRLAPAGVLVLVALVAGGFALTIASPPRAPGALLPGQAKCPQVQYADVISGNGRGEVDAYRLASKLHLVVPRARFRGDDLMMWYPPGQSGRVNQPAAQYLWHVNSLRETMPALRRADAKTLRTRKPGLLLLLSETGGEFPAALRSLSDASFHPTALRREVLAAGSLRLHVWVVRLSTFTPPQRAGGGNQVAGP